MSQSAAVFAAVFIALHIAHTVGDHWVQTSCQAAQKGQHDRNPGESSRAGRLACARHVASLTLTKGLALAPVVLVLDLPVTAPGLALGLATDAISHYWADRRTTLQWLAQRCGKGEFYSLGTSTHPAHPVTAKGDPAATLGTGAYALDQSWHTFWLGIAALTIAAV